MAFLGTLQQAFNDAIQSNGTVIEKLSIIAPAVKQEADNLVQVTGSLNEVYASYEQAFGTHDLSEVGTSLKQASDNWDTGFSNYITEKIVRENVDEYPGYPNLSKADADKLAKAVEVEKSKVENDLRGAIGENLFEFGSAVKNGGYEAVEAIDKVISLKDIYSTPTSTGNLSDLCTKIQKTVTTTIEATEKMASAGQRVFKWLMHNDSDHTHSESVILDSLKNIGISKVGIGATAIAGTATGINAMVQAFKTGGITEAISAGQAAYTNVRKQWDSSIAAREKYLAAKEEFVKTNDNGRHPFWQDYGQGESTGAEPPVSQIDMDNIDGTDEVIRNQSTDTTSTSNPESPDSNPNEGRGNEGKNEGRGNEGKNESKGNEGGANEGGAEYVSEINFVLNGTPGEANSECSVDGVSYLISNYQLSQSMLSPMSLTFTLSKKTVAEESEKDVKYNVCKQIIGLDVDLTVKTKTSETNADANTFRFKGLITGVSASRGTGGTPSIFVTASSYDYILNAAPNCRSFENKTLEEIVTTVTSSCSKLECRINPRLKTPIPYIVQYNQTDYEFLTSLARRFGEWMYHDGTKFIFGEIVPPSESVVKMRYPGGSIFGHGVDLQLRDLNIMHVSPDLYNYGEDGIKSQTDEGLADKNMHELNEAVWNRVKTLYTRQDIYYPHIGGAFDDGENEGSAELIENSIKVESRGKKAQMFTSNGTSKVAGLFLGQQFEIEDGIEKTSSADKQDLLQHPLMILSVSHTFNSDQSYDNTFEAIPTTCDYPPYGNADIFAAAFPQRATIVDNQDPQGLGRVRVQFPWQKVQDKEDNRMMTPWIRVSQPYGGFSKGTQFISEVGEEVMVGFEMDNIERPYVLGALFNGTDNPDPDWMAKVAEGTANNIKAIRTRNGHTIQFNDEGDGGDIQIYDYEKNNYLIHLSSDGQYIRIEAKGDIQISAGNNIGIKAGKNITIEAGENISMDSGLDTDINADANMSISAENNMQQEATDIFVKAKDAVSQESGNSHIIKTTTLQEKSSGKTSIDGGGLVEITASSVKVR